MNYSGPYRQRIPRPVSFKIKKWGWDSHKAFRIGGPFIGFGLAQLILIMVIDLPKHDWSAPSVRMALALFFLAMFTLSGLTRKIIDKTILE